MSRFYACIQGNRGSATRQGTLKSGLSGHIRGWHVGARVTINVNKDGEDEIVIYKTGGSRNPLNREEIARFTD